MKRKSMSIEEFFYATPCMRYKELIEAIRMLEGTDVRFEQSKKGDVRDTYADVSKAREVLGYEPEVGLRDGLEREVEWLRAKGL